MEPDPDAINIDVLEQLLLGANPPNPPEDLMEAPSKRICWLTAGEGNFSLSQSVYTEAQKSMHLAYWA